MTLRELWNDQKTAEETIHNPAPDDRNSAEDRIVAARIAMVFPTLTDFERVWLHQAYILSRAVAVVAPHAPEAFDDGGKARAKIMRAHEISCTTVRVKVLSSDRLSAEERELIEAEILAVPEVE